MLGDTSHTATKPHKYVEHILFKCNSSEQAKLQRLAKANPSTIDQFYSSKEFYHIPNNPFVKSNTERLPTPSSVAGVCTIPLTSVSTQVSNSLLVDCFLITQNENP